MCFSATASFTASAVLATIGVATLRHVREPRALLFASVPLLFAFHQFSEGMVWLALEGRLGVYALDHVVFVFTLYAIGILPLLMGAVLSQRSGLLPAKMANKHNFGNRLLAETQFQNAQRSYQGEVRHLSRAFLPWPSSRALRFQNFRPLFRGRLLGRL